ncbi:hypothetical protein EGO53_29020 (plasmid) [Serratia liquefaciens]|uniref:Uncharacterized protein n=2 Tax=Serratia liquefaciens TaxID=614 RepID=A0A515D610_SERLI|nr:hypothetical protein EGO53_29020 [Serratia liquefaciens]
MGLRIQQFANKVVLAAGGVVGVVSTGVWAAQGSRLGSIVTRGIIPIAVLAGTAVANHAVTNKITVVNQMAAHIKNLADMFNSIHNAFIDFSSESKSKHAQFMPEPPSENGTITFENKVTDNNAVPTNYTDSIQAIVRRFITGTYQRVDIVGQSDMFIKVFFSDGELVISQCEYDFLSILKC